MFKAALTLVMISSSADAQGMRGRIDLECDVSGSAIQGTVGTVTNRGEDGQTEYGTVMGQMPVALQDQVLLWVEGDDGRMHVPKAIVPRLHGGDNGWFKLKKLSVTDDEISGKVAISAVNNPKFSIDRYTGKFRLSGKTGVLFGTCGIPQPRPVERKF
ncbi:MAG: hypothetical protein H6914_07960 [Novosphingobium sp.]|nr:hypothetical protein [Novosphingobium sp.]